jgi:DNA-binding response OmpR family regulator
MTHKILLIENDKNLSKILRAYFEAKGFGFTYANTANDALKKYSSDLDMCIIDIGDNCKYFAGLAEEFKKSVNGMPIIYIYKGKLCDNITIEDIDELQEKPFTMEHLHEKINLIYNK